MYWTTNLTKISSNSTENSYIPSPASVCGCGVVANVWLLATLVVDFHTMLMFVSLFHWPISQRLVKATKVHIWSRKRHACHDVIIDAQVVGDRRLVAFSFRCSINRWFHSSIYLVLQITQEATDTTLHKNSVWTTLHTQTAFHTNVKSKAASNSSFSGRCVPSCGTHQRGKTKT